MPTPMTHALVGAAMAQAAPEGISKPKAALVLSILAAAPDLDIIGYHLGVMFGETLGHRGLTHSLLVALVVGVTAGVACWWKGRTISALYFGVLAFVAVASHGLLDAGTTGGPGVGLLLPFDAQRFFFDWRPIEVCAINPSRFIGSVTRVLASEALWVWLPLAAMSAAYQSARLILRGRRSDCGSRAAVGE